MDETKSACWEAGSMNELRVITPVSTLNEKRPAVYCEKHSFFTAYAESLQEVLAAADWTNVLALCTVLFQAWEKRKKVFICGNGGAVKSFMAESQYSLEPILNLPGSSAFHHWINSIIQMQ